MRSASRKAIAVPLALLLALAGAASVHPLLGKDKEAAELAGARAIFQRNLDAIRRHDLAAYLACYLHSDHFAQTGPGGVQLGFDAHAALSAKESWPDRFAARDLQLVRLSPGVVYGTYRYRVRYGEREESGISERLFLKGADGWKIAVTSAFDAPPGTPPPPLALVGATLIDGTGAAPVPDAVVVMRGGKIDCAGTRAACPVPAGVQALNLVGNWITPGLVDAHVHLSQTGWADGRPNFIDVRDTHPYDKVEAELRAHPQRWFRTYLCSGVTAIFDVGGYPWTWSARERAERDTRSPHLSTAGPLLSTIDFWLNLPAEKQFIYLKDPNAAVQGVDYLVSHGTNAVKVWFIVRPDADFEAMAAAVKAAGAEARRLKVPLIVHATGLKEAKEALRDGAHLLVHSVQDQPVDDEFLEMAKANGAIYCPTLTVMGGYARLAKAAAAHEAPEVDDPGGCVDQATMDLVEETAKIPADKIPQRADALEKAIPALRKTMDENLMKVHAAGIPIAMGTDAGNPLTLHGISVLAEMQAMQDAGLTPMEVIVASTRGGAEAMGRSKEFGTVEAGKDADLVVLASDPTASVAAFRRIKMVVRGGEVRAANELRVREAP